MTLSWYQELVIGKARGNDRRPVSGPHTPKQVSPPGVTKDQDKLCRLPWELLVFWPTEVIWKIPVQWSTKPVQQEFPL